MSINKNLDDVVRKIIDDLDLSNEYYVEGKRVYTQEYVVKSIKDFWEKFIKTVQKCEYRLERYDSFLKMEQNSPEIRWALDLYVDIICNRWGRIEVSGLFSEEISKLLENIKFQENYRFLVRNCLLYGDSFLYLNRDPEQPTRGIVGAYQINPREISYNEGAWDKHGDKHMFDYDFRNLESWEVCHFRLIDNDDSLPYGTSLFSQARPIYNQIKEIENSYMNSVRSGNLPQFPGDLINYLRDNMFDCLLLKDYRKRSYNYYYNFIKLEKKEINIKLNHLDCAFYMKCYRIRRMIEDKLKQIAKTHILLMYPGETIEPGSIHIRLV